MKNHPLGGWIFIGGIIGAVSGGASVTIQSCTNHTAGENITTTEGLVASTDLGKGAGLIVGQVSGTATVNYLQ